MREKRCPFLTLFRFRGSRGGPLGETPSPSRPTWLSETPSLGVGGGRRGSPSPGANRRIRPKPAGSWAGAPRGGAWNPAPRPPPNSPKIPSYKTAVCGPKGLLATTGPFQPHSGGAGGRGASRGISAHLCVAPRFAHETLY